MIARQLSDIWAFLVVCFWLYGFVKSVLKTLKNEEAQMRRGRYMAAFIVIVFVIAALTVFSGILLFLQGFFPNGVSIQF